LKIPNASFTKNNRFFLIFFNLKFFFKYFRNLITLNRGANIHRELSCRLKTHWAKWAVKCPKWAKWGATWAKWHAKISAKCDANWAKWAKWNAHWPKWDANWAKWTGMWNKLSYSRYSDFFGFPISPKIYKFEKYIFCYSWDGALDSKVFKVLFNIRAVLTPCSFFDIDTF
jgi:hypothetical protein